MHKSGVLRSLVPVVLLVGVGCAVDDGGDGLGVGATVQAATAGSGMNKIRCATQEPTMLQRDAADAQAAQRIDLRASNEKLKVPVHFHIIVNSDGDGDVTALIPAQVQVLNRAYAIANVKFNVASVEVVQNDDWYFATPGDDHEIAMKVLLRRGKSNALNIYTGVNDGSLLGWATFPSDYKRFPWYDGVVLDWESFPGAGLEFPFDPAQEPDGLITYDEGDTGTHEVGHWLGLFHTFEGGCSNGRDSDRIDDTPAEAEPQFFCKDRDSCTGKKFAGTDPIHNFMDYVDDPCMDQFTTDQNARMRKQFNTFRAL